MESLYGQGTHISHPPLTFTYKIWEGINANATSPDVPAYRSSTEAAKALEATAVTLQMEDSPRAKAT